MRDFITLLSLSSKRINSAATWMTKPSGEDIASEALTYVNDNRGRVLTTEERLDILDSWLTSNSTHSRKEHVAVKAGRLLCKSKNTVIWSGRWLCRTAMSILFVCQQTHPCVLQRFFTQLTSSPISGLCQIVQLDKG